MPGSVTAPVASVAAVFGLTPEQEIVTGLCDSSDYGPPARISGAVETAEQTWLQADRVEALVAIDAGIETNVALALALAPAASADQPYPRTKLLLWLGLVARAKAGQDVGVSLDQLRKTAKIMGLTDGTNND
jgi:hypothetical protein